MEPLHIIGLFGLFFLIFVFNVIRRVKGAVGKLKEAGIEPSDIPHLIEQAKQQRRQ